MGLVQILSCFSLTLLMSVLMNHKSLAQDIPNPNYYTDHDQYLADWNSDWAMLSGRLHQPKCVDIPDNLTLCRDIGYSQMRLPNLLDHDTIGEVTSQAGSWESLIGIRCHPDTKLFLCSLYSPVCLDRTIWPCRSLCDAVKNKCESYMKKWGFPWPEMLRCDKFPIDNDLCINLQNDAKPDDRTCEPCSKPETFEAIVDNFCSADFVVKMRIQENVITQGHTKITVQRKKRMYKKGDLKKREIRELQLWIENGERCECTPVDTSTNPEQFYLAMGRRRGNQLFITYLQVFDRKSKALKEALRAIRKKNICKDGIHALTTTDLDEGTPEETKKDEVPPPPDAEIEGGRKGNRKNNKNNKKKNRKNRKDRKDRKDRKEGGRKGKRDRLSPEERNNRRRERMRLRSGLAPFYL